MKKAEITGGQAQELLLPPYGKKKLLEYADTFHELADTFTYKGEEDSQPRDRQTYLIKRRMMEDREILADHLHEISRIIREMAEESWHFCPLKARELKRIIHACRDSGLQIQSMYRMEDQESGLKLAVTMCADSRHVMTAEDAAELLSVMFDRRLLPEKDSLFFLSGEYETIVFEEEAAYSVLTGAAKATRENERMSGDTYAFIEKGNGSLLMALSDGMGSGEKAMADSEAVIDLLEKFIEAGFSKETAAEMINGVLLARLEEENMSTLDVCDVNLYTGMCELMKIGSSYTYIKRADTVEQLFAENLPLGIFHRLDVDKQHRQLQDGDYVIVISDGVVDGLESEEVLRLFLEQLRIQNPQEMANCILQFVLHRTKGKIQDDMTVLVLGIWETV